MHPRHVVVSRRQSSAESLGVLRRKLLHECRTATRKGGAQWGMVVGYRQHIACAASLAAAGIPQWHPAISHGDQHAACHAAGHMCDAVPCQTAQMPSSAAPCHAPRHAFHSLHACHAMPCHLPCLPRHLVPCVTCHCQPPTPTPKHQSPPAAHSCCTPSRGMEL